jgi:hypothetical protein
LYVENTQKNAKPKREKLFLSKRERSSVASSSSFEARDLPLSLWGTFFQDFFNKGEKERETTKQSTSTHPTLSIIPIQYFHDPIPPFLDLVIIFLVVRLFP